jgi:amino acid transporter
MLSGDPVTKILLGLALPVSVFASGLAEMAFATRILFALSFDRLMPVGVAKVSTRTHGPPVAIAIVAVLAVAFAALTTYVTLTTILGLLSLFFALILVAGGTAATFLAHRRPDLVRRAGQSDVDRWLGVPRSTWIGGLATALGLFTAVEVVVHQSAYGQITVSSVVTLVVVLVAGPVIYFIARGVRRSRDHLDLSMAMHELPPE